MAFKPSEELIATLKKQAELSHGAGKSNLLVRAKNRILVKFKSYRHIDLYNKESRQIICVEKRDDYNKADTDLEVGRIYTLRRIEVGNWYSTIYLKECGRLHKGYNSVLFREIKKK